MGKKEQVPALAIFVQGSLWVWSATSRGRPPDGGLALAVFSSCQTLTLGLTVALLLAENPQRCSSVLPSPSCYCLLLLLLLFSGQQAENAKNPGKTRKYLGFSGYFRVLPALDAGDRRGTWVTGHCTLVAGRPSSPPYMYCCSVGLR